MVYNLYNSNTIIQGFCDYLKSSGLTKNSVRFYKSDLKHFSNWLLTKIKSLGASAENLKDALPFLTPDLAGQYRKNLVNNKTPVKSVNRKLSALRKFSEYLFSADLISADFTRGLENIGGNINREQSLIGDFKKHLEDQKASANTIKNYLSDIRRFLNKTPPGQPSLATLKRKQSSLGKFFAWSQKPPFYASFQEKIVAALSAKPRAQKFVHTLFYRRPKWYTTYHDISITSYFHLAILIIFSAALGIGAYEQFFRKTSTPLAYPTALTRPNRYLSFQGRLTNNLGTPVTIATNLVFKLYDAETVGNTLWNSGTCSITPDGDGIFSTLLGSACGSEITAAVFSENASVWVGVTVGTDAEATPRVQIATVGYALNAETLQGFSAGTAVSSIPYIDSTGTLVIAAASPKIQSSSGTFAIEGQAMTITTPDTTNGSITVAPDGTGALNLTFEGAAAGGAVNGFVNATNANITSGALYGGTVASAASGYNFIDFQSGVSPASKFSVSSTGQITTAAGLTIGTTSLSETTAANDSGAYLVGAFDEFDNSASANVQAVLNDLDAAIASGGAGSMWTLGSGVIYPTSATNDFAVGGTSLAASMFGIDESAGNFYFGYDNSANPTLNFEATDADAGEFGFNTNDAFFFSNANVGIGTTNPSNKLHVEGQCITGDSLLTMADGSAKRIDNIKAEERVLSLNEETGKIEPHTINGLLDMGVKPIYKLTTQDGKTIKTTGNHPYLVKTATKNPDTRSGLVHLTNSLNGWTDNLESNISPKKEFVKSPIKRGVDLPGVEPGRLGLSIQPSEPAKPTPSSFWVKVISLSIGDEIAVAGQGSTLSWSKIASIEELPAEQVWDIEVEGTHNFVANGIIAHNTYISGNLGIGVTSPTQKLDILGNLQFSGALMPNSAAGSSGNFLISAGADNPPTWTTSLPSSTTIAFTNITSGSNTQANMSVGTGATLNYAGTGTINASSLIGATWAAPGTIGSGTPNTGAFTTLSASGALAANGGITFDSAADTLGAHTLAGTLDANANIITNIGNTGTDFVASTGALNLAAILTMAANAGITMTSGTGQFSQTYTGTTTDAMTLVANSLSSGDGLNISSSGTGVTGNLIDVTLSGSNAANTGSLLMLTNSGTDNANTAFYIKHYATGTGNLAMRVDDESGDTTPFVIDGAGNVGIGTTGPGDKLEVAGNVKVTGGNVTGAAGLINANGNPGLIDFVGAPVTEWIGISSAPERAGSVGTAYGLRSQLRISSGTQTGGVGLLLDPPSGTVTNYTGILSTRIAAPTGNYFIYDASGYQSYISGNVGIGTTSPIGKFEVGGTLGGTSLSGNSVFVTTTGNSSGTTYLSGFQSYLSTAASAYTVGSIYNFVSNDLQTKGAGSAVTNMYGFNAQTMASGVNNYGFWTNQAAGVNNYSFYGGPAQSYFSGNVGIGTTGPSHKLNIVTTTDNDGLLINETDGGNYAVKLATFTNGGQITLFGDSVTNVLLSGRPNGNSYFNSGGNVGIGTTAPLSKLEVNGVGSFSLGAVGAPGVSFNGDLNTGMWSSAADTLNFSTGGSERVRITSAGNVGIGTTSPGQQLEIANAGSTVYANQALTLYNAGSVAYYPNYVMRKSKSNTLGTLGTTVDTDILGAFLFSGVNAAGTPAWANVARIYAVQNGAAGATYVPADLVFDTSDGASAYQPRMTIKSTGNVGIGTTGPGEKLEVVGNIKMPDSLNNWIGSSSGEGMLFDGTGNYGTVINSQWGAAIVIDTDNNSSVNKFMIGKDAADPDSATALVTVLESGNVGIGTTAPGEKLSVSGNIAATGYVSLGNASVYLAREASDLRFYVGGGSAGNIKMTILDTGNVGIGTTGPQTKLQVVGGGISIGNTTTGETNPYLRLNSTTTSWFTQVVGGQYNISTTENGGNIVTILSGGNVGIGTTGPNLTGFSNSKIVTIADLTVEHTGVLELAGNTVTSGNSAGLIAFYNSGSASSDKRLGQINGVNEGGASGNSGGLQFYTMNAGALTTAVRIDKSGNVGIGTTGPNYRLHVNTSDSGSSYLQFTNSTTGGTAADGVLVGLSDDEQMYLWNIENSSMYLGTNNSARLRISAAGGFSLGSYTGTDAGAGNMIISGNVGIGTTGPDNKLHVFNGSAGTVASDGNSVATLETSSHGYLQFLVPDAYQSGIIFGVASDNDKGSIYYNDTSGLMRFSTNGVNDRMVINSTGNVGIGTTGPGATLHVYHTAATGQPLILEAPTGASQQVGIRLTSDSSSWTTGIHGGDSDKFKISNYTGFGTNDYVTITTAGNVGIGTTGPDHKLEVYGDAQAMALNYPTASSYGQLGFYEAGVLKGYVQNIGSTWAEAGRQGDLELEATGDITLQTTSGNVGIGTTGPGTKLHVYSNVAGALNLDHDATNYPTLQFSYTGGQRWAMAPGANYYFYFYNKDGTERFQFQDNGGFQMDGNLQVDGTGNSYIQGNVGIGTTAPGEKLSVSGNIAATGYVSLGNASVYLAREASDLRFYVGGGSAGNIKMTILDTGNVGIGTTAPLSKLEVNGVGSFSLGAVGAPGVSFNGDLNTGMWSSAADTLNFSTGGSERVRITSAGNVGIGTTGPQYKLSLGSTNDKIGYYYDGTHNASVELYNSSSANMTFNMTNGISSSGFVFQGGTNNLVKIAYSGNVGIGTTNPGGTLEVASGNVFFGDTSNANSTQGLTINQGSADDGILALKSSDVAHGITAAVETDTYGYFSKYSAAAGGLSILGLVETGVAGALTLSGYSGLADTTKTTAGLGGTMLSAALVNGTTVQDMTADGNLFVIRNRATARFIFDAEGTMHSIGAGGIDTFGAGGATIMSGNVGIGTTGPGQKLHLIGANGATIQALIEAPYSDGSAGYYGGIQLGNNSTQNAQLLFSSAGDNSLSIKTNYSSGTGNYISFSPGGTERVRFQQDGNVGIGTTGPSHKLNIVTTTDNDGLLINETDGGNYAVKLATFTNGGQITLFGDSVTNVLLSGRPNGNSYFNSGGNVGIGTTSPGQQLEIANAGSTVYANQALTLYNAGSVAYYPNYVMRKSKSNTLGTLGTTVDTDILGAFLFSGVNAAGTPAWANVARIYAVQNGAAGATYVPADLVFDTSDGASAYQPRMTIKSTGNVGIGTTAPGEKLSVSGNIAATGYVSLGNASVYLAREASDLRFYVGGGSAGNIKMTILDTGNVGIGTTSPSQKLHVVGNCVAGSTLLPIRRRRRRKFNDLESGDDEEENKNNGYMDKWLNGSNSHPAIQPSSHSDWEYLLVPISDILPGDEVLSLNEGQWEGTRDLLQYAKINALIDMDIKEVYELTTKSGKVIRTTANHPYLTLLENSPIANEGEIEI